MLFVCVITSEGEVEISITRLTLFVTRLRVKTVQYSWLRAFELLVPRPVLCRKLHGKLKVTTPNAPVCEDLAPASENTLQRPGISQLKSD